MNGEMERWREGKRIDITWSTASSGSAVVLCLMTLSCRLSRTSSFTVLLFVCFSSFDSSSFFFCRRATRMNINNSVRCCVYSVAFVVCCLCVAVCCVLCVACCVLQCFYA